MAATVLAALGAAPVVQPECDGLTPDQAARAMGIGRSTVYEATRSGELAYIQKGKRGKIIPHEEIARWKEARFRRGTSRSTSAMEARIRLVKQEVTG
ncbi:MAG: helix-turn-helix domain-containing protein [Candidatus Binatia bacterium]